MAQKRKRAAHTREYDRQRAAKRRAARDFLTVEAKAKEVAAKKATWAATRPERIARAAAKVVERNERRKAEREAKRGPAPTLSIQVAESTRVKCGRDGVPEPVTELPAPGFHESLTYVPPPPPEPVPVVEAERPPSKFNIHTGQWEVIHSREEQERAAGRRVLDSEAFRQNRRPSAADMGVWDFVAGARAAEERKRMEQDNLTRYW